MLIIHVMLKLQNVRKYYFVKEIVSERQDGNTMHSGLQRLSSKILPRPEKSNRSSDKHSLIPHLVSFFHCTILQTLNATLREIKANQAQPNLKAFGYVHLIQLSIYHELSLSSYSIVMLSNYI